jgi:cephalosporin-C deacetylase
VYVDLPLEQLREYRSSTPEPAGFGEFWETTLAAAREHPLAAEFRPFDAGLVTVDTFDVEYAGFGGHRIRGWLQVPREVERPMPCVVEYIGYGSGRALPQHWLLFSAAGYAHLVMDTRGQGEAMFPGDTADQGASGASQATGFVTRGILDPFDHYYRRVFTDAVRAVEAARSHPAIDADRIVVAGGSQGGGISLAVAGMVPGLAAALPDIPFLCHFRRAATITDKRPYAEIAAYCGAHRDQVDTVFDTLDHFDGVNFATRATAPALFSVALMDDVCPPSTVFAAYNAYAGPKQIRVWPFNAHEGGLTHQSRERLTFLSELFSAAAP